ncbi:MAG: lysophospholipase, partial [Chloroflexi bacterium]|nr:lysophospholipase [Chloroflexota bacterium]
AVVRYNKHYVVSATQADTRAFHTKLTLQQMLVDAGTVLAAAESNSHIDPHSIFLYGWSEGSTVAAALAVQHPELAGLIVQGAVTEPWLQLFRYQITAVGVPYLRQFAPDGNVTLHTVQQAVAGPGGLVAEEGALFMRNLDAQRAENGLNPFFDPTHAGVINIDKQFLPKLNAFLQILLSPRGPLGIYAADRALPDVTQQAPQLHLPVLILQGENDANVPPSGATVLYNALTGTTDKTLKLFPGLGHSLGPASSKVMDDFAPIAQAPLQALITWLNSHRMPNVPPTGAGGSTTWPSSEILLLGSLAFFSLGLTKLVHRNHAAVTAKVFPSFSSR